VIFYTGVGVGGGGGAWEEGLCGLFIWKRYQSISLAQSSVVA